MKNAPRSLGCPESLFPGQPRGISQGVISPQVSAQLLHGHLPGSSGNVGVIATHLTGPEPVVLSTEVESPDSPACYERGAATLDSFFNLAISTLLVGSARCAPPPPAYHIQEECPNIVERRKSPETSSILSPGMKCDWVGFSLRGSCLPRILSPHRHCQGPWWNLCGLKQAGRFAQSPSFTATFQGAGRYRPLLHDPG